jgi:hypothetical protein
MNLSAINDIIAANPALLFVAGLIAGFILRGLAGSVFSFSRTKKPSRYRGRKPGDDVKRSATIVDFKEPAPDWPENAVRNIAQRSSRYTAEINQTVKPLPKVAE